MRLFKNIVIATLIFSTMQSQSQSLVSIFDDDSNVNQKIILKQQAIEDINFMVQTLEEVHPNLYHSLQKSEFKVETETLKKALPEQISVYEFCLKLDPIINMLGDGHTKLGAYPKLTKAERDSSAYFPLRIDLFNYTVSEKNDYGVNQGARILTINNQNIEHIVDSILPYMPGIKEERKRAVLEYLLPVYMADLGYKESFDIKYMYHGDTITKTLVGQEQDNFYARSKIGYFKIIKANKTQYGWLKFDVFGDTKDYFNFIDNAFLQLKKDSIKNLVIDLRMNGGGNAMLAQYILKHIANERFKMGESMKTKFSIPTRQYFRKIFNKYSRRRPYMYPLVLMSSQFWKKSGEKEFFYEEYSPFKYEKRFTGKVYLITSHYSFSCADAFSRVFKYYKIGKIIGQETGGTRDLYADPMSFKLPNSKINCFCSYKQIKGLDLTDLPTDGVKPDYPLDCRHLSNRELVDYIEKHVKDKDGE